MCFAIGVKHLTWDVDEGVLPLDRQPISGYTTACPSNAASLPSVVPELKGNTPLPSHISSVLVCWNRLTAWASGPLERKYLSILAEGADPLERNFDDFGAADSHRGPSH